MDPLVVLGLTNLHDAFLNASLTRNRMLKEPLDSDPTTFHMSDRARFERLWIALLAVLVEAWRSPQTRPVVDYIASVANVDNLVLTLDQMRSTGQQGKMVQCRHYMFHRDRREYWDEGRVAPAGNLEVYTKLHQSFGTVLLVALRAMKAELGADKPCSVSPTP